MTFFSDIYFLDAGALSRELRDGTISDARAVKHVIIALILGGVGFEVPVGGTIKDSMGIEQVVVQVLGFLLGALITYYGMWLLYQANNKGDGKDFFKRFAVLTLPVGLYLALLFLVIGAALLGLTMLISSMSGEAGFVVLIVGFAIASISFTALFFLRMRRYLAIACGAT